MFGTMGRNPDRDKDIETLTREKREEVEQLKKEAAFERMPASDTLAEMLNFVNEERKNDAFLNGQLLVSNPFEPKKRCVIL